MSHLTVGLYTNDTNGGLAMLEAIDLGCLPVAPDVYEYSWYFREWNWPESLRIRPDLNNTVEVLDRMIDLSKSSSRIERDSFGDSVVCHANSRHLIDWVRRNTAYENTTRDAMIKLGLLQNCPESP